MALRYRQGGKSRKLAFVQILMLTGQRRDEVAGMRWAELKDGGLWTIAGARTKNGLEHDVPLGEQAQAILVSAPRSTGSDFVFTTTGATPISGYSNAKERLDAFMLQVAREEATEGRQDAAAVALAPHMTFGALRPQGWPAWASRCM
jgi:integrase